MHCSQKRDHHFLAQTDTKQKANVDARELTKEDGRHEGSKDPLQTSNYQDIYVPFGLALHGPN